MKTYTRLVVGALAAFLITFTLNINLQAQPFAPTNAPGAAAQPAGPEYVPGEVLIKFREDVSDDQIATAFRGAELQLIKHIQTPRMRDDRQIGITRVATKLPVQAALQALANVPGVEYAQPNWIYKKSLVPSEQLDELWGMRIYPGAAAEGAWNEGDVGSAEVCVGIIDTGIQVAHPDLAPNIWVNEGETLDGVDNDNNGYIDDINGWNALNDNGQVFLSVYDDHGTHVAGTIGAAANNGGVVGVNWHVKMISGKFLGGPDGSGSTADAIQAIDYMVNLKTKKGVNIVALNNSWGGGGYDTVLLSSIVACAKANILFVAAAGNGNPYSGQPYNIDSTPHYPACYNTTAGAGYDAVVSVTAVDADGLRATWANYGSVNVDLGAPGVHILSTLPTGMETFGYGYGDGTSMAAPHVTGAIALYSAKYPSAFAALIKDTLMGSSAPAASMAAITVTRGVLAIPTFLLNEPITSNEQTPSTPTGFAASPLSSAEIQLSWADTANETGYTLKRYIGTELKKAINIPANMTSFVDSGLQASTTYSYELTADNMYATPKSSAAAGVAATTKVVSTATLLNSDTTTRGSWVGKYGKRGYDIIATRNTSQISVSGSMPPHTWSPRTTDKRALQTTDGRSRFAMCYFQFAPDEVVIHVNLAANETRQVALYCLDWENQGRAQDVKVFDPSGAKLNETTLNGFGSGVYLKWNVTGSVIIKLKQTGTANAAVSGIFLDDIVAPPPTGTLAPPTALTATPISKSQIKLTWTDNSNNEAGFKIERSNSATTGFSQIGTVGANVTSYTSTGLARSTTYYYRVRATNGGGDSAYSNTASATTPAR